MQAQSSSQSQSNTTPNQPSTSQNQTTTQSQTVTLTGCVYQASDSPDAYALERVPGASSSTTSGTSSSTSPTSSSSATTSNSGAASTSSSATGRRRTGWFRLSSAGAQKLSEFVGQEVQVMGTVRTPQEQSGGEVVVHEVRPNQVTVTTIDLRPAPELRIQSIRSIQGTCGNATANN